MSEWILAHEPAVRLGAFLSVFILMAGWELLASRRALTQSKPRRWFGNLGIVVVNTVVLRVVFPTAAIGIAWTAQEHGWGLLHHVAFPEWAKIIAAIVLLDLAIYGQHVVFHHVPPLWRLHLVHHADKDLDVTSGLRFHPVEIVLSMVIKFGVVIALGAPPLAVLIFDVVLNGTSMFNHTNGRLPGAVDAIVRALVVTPDMHRVHHSAEPGETNSNFGFNLSLWDRVFGTYRAQPAAGHAGMHVGLDYVDEASARGLPSMLVLPFVVRPSRQRGAQKGTHEH